MTEYMHVVVDEDELYTEDRRAFEEDAIEAAREYAEKEPGRVVIMDVPIDEGE